MQVSWIDVENLNALLAKITPQELTRETDPPPSMVLGEPDVPATAEDFMGCDAEPADPTAFHVAQEAPEEPHFYPQQAPAPPFAASAPTSASAEDPETALEPPLPQAAAALPLSRIRDKLRAIRQRASAAGMLGRSAEASVAPPTPVANAQVVAAPELPALPAFVPPEGSLQERLAAFAHWTRQLLHEDGGHVLVMNDDGELLWGGEAKAGLVLSAMMAWNAAVRGSAHLACETLPIMRQTLASGHMLTVVPCEASGGVLFHAAVAAPESLSNEVAQQLRQALSQTMEGHASAENLRKSVIPGQG